jgi:CheY-like chemotaxis protein
VTAPPQLVHVSVGPVSARSGRAWATASRRTLETVKTRPDLDVPADVVASFERYLGEWEQAMADGSDVFRWTGEVDAAELQHLAAHWARLVNLARDDSETALAPADPLGQEFYDALATAFVTALAAADGDRERFAPIFEDVVPEFAGARAADPRGGEPARRVRVLLVDDHPDIRLLVRIGLEADGAFDVAEATDGQEALDALCPSGRGDGCPDAVLLDLAMPVMDGMEALPRIVERCPGTKVVIFSANDEPANRRKAAGLGAAGFLPKGAPMAEIVDALRSR